jgi:arsenate reductase (thioredoxin)
VKKVLFLCTGNIARSQMAEALANAFHGDVVHAVSAGSRPGGGIHPYAVRALAEKGIDAAGAPSKNASEFLNEEFDVVVTVCDSAAQDCPVWPGAKRLEHWPIADPGGGGYPRFVEIRDELEQRIGELVASLAS